MMKIIALLATFCILQVSAYTAEKVFQPAVNFKDAPISHSQSRIVNGLVAQPEQFPYQATVRSNAGPFCGGSLISINWVLTAAQCVVGGTSFTIGLGSNNAFGPLRSYSTTRVVSHPNYNSATFENDVALLKLPVPVLLSSAIQTVRLPRAAQAYASFENAVSTVSGFGRYSDSIHTITGHLRYVQLRIISNRECAFIYSNGTITSHIICGRGLTASNQGTCNFDSGGPLVINENGPVTQIGVVSFVAAIGCEKGYPSGFARTASHLTWINEVTAIPIRI